MGTTVSSKGQVVIPKKFRDAIGITPGSRVEFEAHGNVLELKISRHKKHSRLEDGYGMLKYNGKLLPDDFDVATLLAKGEK